MIRGIASRATFQAVGSFQRVSCLPKAPKFTPLAWTTLPALRLHRVPCRQFISGFAESFISGSEKPSFVNKGKTEKFNEKLLELMMREGVTVAQVDELYENITVTPNLITFKLLLKFYKEKKRWTKLFGIVSAMEKIPVAPDAEVFAFFLDGIVALQANKYSSRVALFRLYLRKLRAHPTKLPRDTVLRMCQFNKVLPSYSPETVRSCLKYYHGPYDIEIYNILMESSGLNSEEVEYQFNRAKKDGCTPTLETYCHLISSYLNLPGIEKKCSKIEPIISIVAQTFPGLSVEYQSLLISYYTTTQQVEKAYEILNQMDQANTPPEYSKLFQLASYYLHKGNQHEVLRGLAKGTSSWNVLLAACHDTEQMRKYLEEMKMNNVKYDKNTKFIVVQLFLDVEGLESTEKIIEGWTVENPSYGPSIESRIEEEYHKSYLGLIQGGEYQKILDACDRKKRYFGRDKEMRDYQSISVAYYKNVPPLYEKISELIEEMEQKGVQSSRLIYTLLLKYFSEKQDKSKIYDILSSMKFNMTALDNIAVNVLLHMYVKDKDVTGMEHLYNQMFGQNLTPHLDTFNTMLSIYVYNQDSHNVDKILDLLEKKKFLWDSYTYHEVITDYIQRGNSYKASNLFSKMLNDNITPLSATWFILLMHFAKTSYFDTFESFFELAKQSKALPRALLASVTIARRLIQSDKNEDLTSLKNVIEEILSGPELAKLDHTPRMIVYRSLLLYICKRGTVEDVENVTKRFRDIGVPLDEIMYCLLLGFYISNGLSITGLVENMFAEGINDHRPYQFALMYFSENDDFSTFSSVYRRLEERNLMSTALYNNLIMVYCEKGLENLVMTVLDQMIERGFHPNIKTYSVILYMYLQRENFTAFEDFVTRVYKDKVRLDTVFWNVMLKFHSTKGDYGSLKSVFSHLENSEEYHPDLSTYNIMISAFGHKGDLSEAESYFDKLLASGIRPTTKTFESMMLFYVKEDQKEKIFNLFPKMKECKVSPNPRFYHFLLNFLLRDSQWDDLKQVMKVMEETGVAIEERLATTVKGKMVEKQRPDVIEVLDRLDKHKVILREIY